MWNSGHTVTRATWQVRPALRTEQFFTAVHEMRSAGATDKRGSIAVPAAGMIFKAFPDEFRLVMPELARRPAIALLAAIGRLRGYPGYCPTTVKTTAGPVTLARPEGARHHRAVRL